MANHEPRGSQSEPLTAFALPPCLADSRVHAIYDRAAPYPDAVCGVNIIPDIYLPGPVTLCHRC
jgi:hypothetical protein